MGVNIRIDNDDSVYEEHVPVSRNEYEDCCGKSKAVWDKHIKEFLGHSTDPRADSLMSKLLLKDMDCIIFKSMLEEIHNTTDKVTLNNIASKYLLKSSSKNPESIVSISLFESGLVSSTIKSAGTEALSTWITCAESWRDSDLKITDTNWQSQILASQDLRFQTWDNTLRKMTCPECREGKLRLTTYHKGKRGMRSTGDRAVLECDKCGHKEVFG